MDSRGKRELAKAYHEAGHAVVARTLGITLSYVTMLSTVDMPAGGALGNSASWLARDTDQATRLAAIEKDMKACLAGPHAQKRYQPRKNKRTPNEWASDFNLAKSLATKAVLITNGRGADIPMREGPFKVTLEFDDLVEIEQLFNRISNETEALVAELWSAITRVAEELLSRPTLFEEEVDALIADRPFAVGIGRVGQ
jgi:hypothetical protein